MTILYTMGHSNHSLAQFLEILEAHEIQHIIDVRTIPRSRFVPWFNQTNMRKVLTQSKVIYRHLPELGGRRHVKKDSINKGWKNASFRGFADYMQTKEFFIGLSILNKFLKRHKKTAILCAEAVPWRCHRSLIADAELIRGVKVYDIFSKTSIKEHVITPFAKVNRNSRPMRIYYPSS